MNEPVHILRSWDGSHEFWFSFEDKVYVQESDDGIEWNEPQLTPYPMVPFFQINLESF